MTAANIKFKGLLFGLAIIPFLSNPCIGQNRLNSRLFYDKPPLFQSESKIDNLYLSEFDVSVSDPVDHRSGFYGELAHKKKKVQRVDEFFQNPTMTEIKKKMNRDLKPLGISTPRQGKIEITTIVEVFYPDVRGFIWGKSFAKVRLIMAAQLNDIELVNEKYEAFYITNGTDKEFEGSKVMTIEQGANVTIGMTLRKALDDFYFDLKEKLKTNH